MQYQSFISSMIVGKHVYVWKTSSKPTSFIETPIDLPKLYCYRFLFDSLTISCKASIMCASRFCSIARLVLAQSCYATLYFYLTLHSIVQASYEHMSNQGTR